MHSCITGPRLHFYFAGRITNEAALSYIVCNSLISLCNLGMIMCLLSPKWVYLISSNTWGIGGGMHVWAYMHICQGICACMHTIYAYMYTICACMCMYVYNMCIYVHVCVYIILYRVYFFVYVCVHVVYIDCTYVCIRYTGLHVCTYPAHKRLQNHTCDLSQKYP